jgi:hypothetical protein
MTTAHRRTPILESGGSDRESPLTEPQRPRRGAWAALVAFMVIAATVLLTVGDASAQTGVNPSVCNVIVNPSARQLCVQALTTNTVPPISAPTIPIIPGLYGASLYIARASDPRAARAEVDVVLDTLISGLLGGAAR